MINTTTVSTTTKVTITEETKHNNVTTYINIQHK